MFDGILHGCDFQICDQWSHLTEHIKSIGQCWVGDELVGISPLSQII